MKTTKYIMLALLGGLTVLSSCDSMDESYKGYLEGGKIVYRAKAKELVASPGLNRVKLEWQLEYPTQVVKCEVRSGDEILTTLPVKYDDLVKMECMIDNLEERTYTFSVYSLDAQGNSSIKTDVIVDIYGERYMNTLFTERSIQEIWRKVEDSSQVLVTLPSNASTKLAGTDLTYQSVSGGAKTIRLLPEQNVVELTDVAADSYFNLQDSWKPVKNAVDEFKAPIRTYAANELPIGSSRTFKSAYKLDDTTVAVSLSTSSASVIKSVISYGSKTVDVQPGIKELQLVDVPENAVLEMLTYVKTGESTVEYMAVKQSLETAMLLKKVSTTDWTVAGFSSSQASEGNVAYTFDGILETYWHTEYSPSQAGYPHYITIKMGAAHTVRGIAVARRNGNTSIAAKMRLEVSMDGETWTSVGEFFPDNSIDGLQLFELSNSTGGNYFKLTGLTPSTATANMCISEINVYE